MSGIIFDTESTGLKEPHLIEAAWLRVPDPNNLVPDATFHQRYNPGKPIELGALATHHIMDEDLVDCPPYSEFALPPCEYLIGHNIDYDWGVIGKPAVKRIDVLALSRHYFPQLDSHKQSAMLYHFVRPQARELLKQAHSAEADVWNCLTILGHLIALIPSESVTWEDVWHRSEHARIPTVMTFGKHKGAAIKDVPADYKRWLLGQPDVDQYLAKALRGEAA
jgi:exodeoxyribonuclease X